MCTVDTDPEGNSLVIEEQIAQFKHQHNLAEIYHVYHNIHQFVVSIHTHTHTHTYIHTYMHTYI